MIAIGKLENRFIVLFISILFISIIGIFDYLTPGFPLSIFYLIPVSLHALYRKTTKTAIVINSLFAAMIWILVILNEKEYKNIYITIWNAAIVLTLFLITGLLLFYLKEKIKETQELNKNLIQLNEEKNKFIGIAAHDLRSPIGTINSFSDLLLTKYSNKLDPDLSRIIGFIRDISNKSLVMLKNLLNVSVIESGNIKLNLKMQDYLEFVKQSLYLNQIIAAQKEILIKLETDKIEINLNFDEHYLSEAINNLLSNAIKFSNKKSEIMVRITQTEKNSVLTEIIDKGKGIPQEEQNKLFHYFQKTSTLPTDGEKSTGLGLAIARKIILEHRGQIGVKSDIGIGSNFYYELS